VAARRLKKCATPHPARAPSGVDVHPDLEVVGSYSDDCWARCRLCGAWVWLTTDLDSKWQYVDAWDLDRTLAERAFVQDDVAAAARLLVVSNLPHGPTWGSTSALLAMLRVITPAATDGQRSAALDAASPTGAWGEAARVLREIATHEPPAAGEMVFAIDARVPGRSFVDFHEIGSSYVLFQDAPVPGILRFDAHAVSGLQCEGPTRFLARNEDAVLFTVTTPEGDALRRIDAFGQVGAFAPSRTRYTATSLDDGGWLFVPDDYTPVRFVEFHDASAFSRVKMRMAFRTDSRFACAPRRMGEGWIVSGCVDDEGEEQALTMFDASFKMIAQSVGARGQRLIERIDDGAIWCETVTPSFTLERWERRDRVLERAFAVATQSWLRIPGGVVASLRAGPLAGFDDSGAELFRQEREVHGATYFAAVRNGVLVHDDRGARIIDPRTGGDTHDAFAVENASVRATRGGVTYVQESTALHVIDETSRRIFVGEGMSLETLCGEDALLRDERGRCLLVSPDGAIRAFDAPHARFTVFGTRGGPYVVEPERVRIGRLP
jgi:hypothetical protein